MATSTSDIHGNSTSSLEHPCVTVLVVLKLSMVVSIQKSRYIYVCVSVSVCVFQECFTQFNSMYFKILHNLIFLLTPGT